MVSSWEISTLRRRRSKRRRKNDPQQGTLEFARQDPHYDEKPEPWPRMQVNHERPYKHPDPIIEKLARRLYKMWCEADVGQRYIPWRLLDPPTDDFRHSSHSGNGRIRARWYRIAERVREELLCDTCLEESL